MFDLLWSRLHDIFIIFWKLIILNQSFSVKWWAYFCFRKKRNKLSEFNTFQARKRRYLSNHWSDKDLKGTVVNRACPSLNGGSLKITATIPLIKIVLLQDFNMCFYCLFDTLFPQRSFYSRIGFYIDIILAFRFATVQYLYKRGGDSFATGQYLYKRGAGQFCNRSISI